MAVGITLLIFQVYCFFPPHLRQGLRVEHRLRVLEIQRSKTIVSKNVQEHPKAQGAVQRIREERKKSVI